MLVFVKILVLLVLSSLVSMFSWLDMVVFFWFGLIDWFDLVFDDFVLEWIWGELVMEFVVWGEGGYDL